MNKRSISVGQLIKKYAIYGGLALALSTGITSCDGKVEVNKYDNVKTTLVETKPNKFEIESEVVTTDTISTVLVKKLDGSTQEMDYEEVAKLYTDKDPMEGYKQEGNNDTYYNSHTGDMWFILWWSNYGYGLGRGYNTPIYRGYYRSPAAYNSAKTTSKKVVSSRTTTRVSRTSSKAPVGARKGYGGSSSRGYSGGSRSHGG